MTSVAGEAPGNVPKVVFNLPRCNVAYQESQVAEISSIEFFQSLAPSRDHENFSLVEKTTDKPTFQFVPLPAHFREFGYVNNIKILKLESKIDPKNERRKIFEESA